MNNLPSLVVVIPTHNRCKLLQRAVTSVFTQTYPSLRIIIVDDGSIDETKNYLKSLQDKRIYIIHFDTNKGVNIARNTALRLLQENEWAVLLDDDDYFAPDALFTVGTFIKNAPQSISVLYFNTYLLKEGVYEQGFSFSQNQRIYKANYFDIMTKHNINGDCQIAFHSSLFTKNPQYFYREDVNGFESELLMRMARDGVGFLYCNAIVKYVDHTHDSTHLSESAARKNPKSFAQAHKRIFSAHKKFFFLYPRVGMERALQAFKISIKAYDLFSASLFLFFYFRFFLSSLIFKGS